MGFPMSSLIRVRSSIEFTWIVFLLRVVGGFWVCMIHSPYFLLSFAFSFSCVVVSCGMLWVNM